MSCALWGLFCEKLNMPDRACVIFSETEACIPSRNSKIMVCGFPPWQKLRGLQFATSVGWDLKELRSVGDQSISLFKYLPNIFSYIKSSRRPQIWSFNFSSYYSGHNSHDSISRMNTGPVVIKNLVWYSKFYGNCTAPVHSNLIIN